ncbi:MAG: FKBP-type peptidyl-prolyl cis-trans isomerase, partial [Lysobacterales bacterium]
MSEAANVAKGKVVSFHYTLSDETGEQLETSRERQPMSYLHGARNIIPGLEKALEGRSAGDSFQVT